MDNYLFSYDDPYKILAHYIVGFYRPADVVRVLNDNAYIATLIQKEVRELDIGGSFLDCIIEDILTKKKRMAYMGHLDTLSKYYYSEFDKDRLRREIYALLEEVDIKIPNYSAAGSVSSAKT